MKNLDLLTHIPLDANPELVAASSLSVDCDTGIVYCSTASQLVGFNPFSGEITGLVSLTAEDYLPSDGSGKVIGLQFIADQQSLCAATNTGNLLLWNTLTGELECVGAVDSGFQSMTWSPDMELLILITGQETFIVMTREFDPVLEKSLHPEGFGDAQFVTVGWGKKETQFHGSEGKSAAKKTIEEVQPALDWDDHKTRVSWRGDGQFFVTSTIHPETGCRQIRVWNREGEHQSTSENVDGIEHALDWKPSGSVIASSIRKQNKHEIAFFEKNGLRHGEFCLPFAVKEVVVKELCWNLDSSILLVWCEDMEHMNGFRKSYIQLWSTGNYHWYLKQSLLFSATEENQLSAVCWDPEQAYRLHIMMANGRYSMYTWGWTVNCSQGDSKTDQTLVAVIDGDRVLLTPMRQMVVPPPMSAYFLQMPCPVNQVAFCCACRNSNDVAILLADNRLALYSFELESTDMDPSVKFEAATKGGFNQTFRTPRLKGMFSINTDDKQHRPLCLYHLMWISDKKFLCCVASVSTSRLFCYELEEASLQLKHGCCIDIPEDSIIYNMCLNHDNSNVILQLTDGTILKANIDTQNILPYQLPSGFELTFPVPCPQIASCIMGGEEVVMGLTERYRFYVNDVEVASNCTSFSLHNKFLILSTLSHTCRCINRTTQVKVLPTLSDGKAHPYDESVRRVERGSKIVAVVHDDTKLILQMPRGNLEAIHPRALVLSAIRQHLDESDFGEAMTYMRKHRINLNLLYDHNPENFLHNVDRFVDQVNSVNHINLFLTDLREEDCTVTMYTAAYNRCPTSSSPNKVNTICEAVRKALEKKDKTKFLLSILTSYVRKSTPDLEAALTMVKSLRDHSLPEQNTNAEDVLKYLLFLVDVNEMFDVALGMYDFDLVLTVAEKSQKDPKEYIPFLNKLRQLEGHYQYYTIDKHLKRFSRALIHIVKSGDEHFEECKSLIIEHKLYRDAIMLFPNSSPKYKVVASLFGDYLSEKKRHEEAGMMYLKAEQWESALAAFESCQRWRQVFCLTAKLKFTPEKEAQMARKIAEQLKAKRQYYEASVLLDQYVKDIEEAIVCLIEGCQWEEAIRMMYKHSRTDFIETNLLGALDESHGQLLEALERSRKEFEKHRSRLKVVRQEKDKAKLELLESGRVVNTADADLFSDTSSATGESVQSSQYSSHTGRSTLFSKVSGTSGKNKRKAENKKWKLKEGSQYEDLALISAISQIIKSVDSMRDEIHSLLKMLLQFNCDKQAKELQNIYDEFLVLIEKSIPEIWIEEEETPALVLGPEATANSIAQAMQRGSSQTKSSQKEDSVIKFPPVLQKESTWKLFVLEDRNKT